MLHKKILSLLTPKERRRGFLLLGMILIMALLDTVGVASILPFMLVLGQPDIVHTNNWLNPVYTVLGYTDSKEFLFFLGILAFTALVLSITFKAITELTLLRFTQMRNYSLSCRLLRGYLDRPYAWFLDRHSANLGKSILSETSQVTSDVLIPAMQFFAHGTVALFLIVLLMALDPLLVLIITMVLGGAYIVIYGVIRNYLTRIGTDRVLANRQRFKVAQEAFGAIKEVKIFGRESSFFERFAGPALRFATHQASNGIASRIPRYILEVLAFGGILLISLYLLKSRGDFNRALPILTVFAFAGYRLLPALQQVYSNLTRLRFGMPALDSLYGEILGLPYHARSPRKENPQPLVPQQSIRLENVHFTYPNARTAALNHLDLTIAAGSTVGIVGATGSGKTTTADILLGLLQAQTGRLLVDGKPVTRDNVRAWQLALGYVPQQIYISDDTVAANIAFGVPQDHINMDAVIRAAKLSALHEFVSIELPLGYETLVGDRGIRLSGGQRQRIGIARALYHDPAVLVFDEATSALDNLTEQAVMKGLRNLGKPNTLIVIAHRLTTVKDCDCIYVLEHGTLAEQGRYYELLETSGRFRSLAVAKRSSSQTDIRS